MEEYVSKAVINKISATSRASIKVKESYYTLEFSEERIIPDLKDVDIEEERRILWNTVNSEVDKQAANTIKVLTSG